MSHQLLTYQINYLYFVVKDTKYHLLCCQYYMHYEVMFSTYSSIRSTCSSHMICAAVSVPVKWQISVETVKMVFDGLHEVKIRLLRSLVISIFLYACESWTLNADLQRRIQAMEMRCYRRLLNISYTEHITNVEVSNRIERAIGPYEDLLTTVKRRKLKWYGHVSRSSGLSKTIMQGTVKGGRRRGGQRKRWEDNIKDWTCLRAAESLRVSKDRNGWREVVRRSVMAPLRPPEVMG